MRARYQLRYTPTKFSKIFYSTPLPAKALAERERRRARIFYLIVKKTNLQDLRFPEKLRNFTRLVKGFGLSSAGRVSNPGGKDIKEIHLIAQLTAFDLFGLADYSLKLKSI